MSGARLDISGLKKSFDFEGRRMMCCAASICASSRARWWVVGASGAGKSTFLHVLGTLDAPTAGSVVIDGKSRLARSAEARGVSQPHHRFVFQFHHLCRSYRIENAPCRPDSGCRRRTPRGGPRPARSRRAVAAAAPSAGELSGGEQQRVALARAW